MSAPAVSKRGDGDAHNIVMVTDGDVNIRQLGSTDQRARSAERRDGEQRTEEEVTRAAAQLLSFIQNRPVPFQNPFSDPKRQLFRRCSTLAAGCLLPVSTHHVHGIQ